MSLLPNYFDPYCLIGLREKEHTVRDSIFPSVSQKEQEAQLSLTNSARA